MELVFLPNNFKLGMQAKLKTKLRRNDWLTLILALTGTLFAMLASDEYFTERPSDNKGMNEESTAVTVLRFFVTLTTLPLLFMIYRHYVLYIQYAKVKEIIDYQTTLASSGYLKWMIIELFI